MDDRTNTAVVQQAYAAFGQGDIPAFLSLLTDDVEWSLPGPSVIPWAGTRHGQEGVTEFFSSIGETLEFERFEPREFVAQGDTVVVLGYERSLVNRRAVRSSKSGRTSTNSGTARSPRAVLSRTRRRRLSHSATLEVI